MKSLIQIERFHYEEPYNLDLAIHVCCGRQSGELEFYCSADDLKRAGDELSKFPLDRNAEFLWELGSEKPEDNSAFYFCFRVYTEAVLGTRVIHVRFNNNETLPEKQITEFCIRAEISKINLLGELLQDFTKLQNQRLWWDTTKGALDDEETRQ